MRNRKKWGALVLAVITIAALTLSGCRKEREKINPDDLEPNTVQVSTESESESESKTTEKSTEKTTEKTSESETTTSESNSTPQSESNNTGNTAPNTTNNGGTDNGTATGTTPSDTTGGTTTGTTTPTTGGDNGSSTGGGTTNNGGDTGTTGGDANSGTTGGDNGDGGAETVTTEAPRYFFDANGSRVDVSQLPDGSWQDANGTSYTFYENGVKDSNGNQYYYDPPSNGNTSVEVGSSADFYDTQGNHIVCTMDENGNWVDSEGNIYIFGENGVTDSSGNFHPY